MFRLSFGLFVVGFLAMPLSAEEHAATARPPRKVWTSSRLKGSPLPPPPLKQVRRFPNLTFKQPLYIERDPASQRMWVITRDANVWSFPDRQDIKEADLFVDLNSSFASLTPHKTAVSVATAYGLAFHPDYPRVPVCWMTYIVKGADRRMKVEDGTRLVRFHVTFDENGIPRCDVSSEKLLLTWPEGGHNGACLKFGADGYLYISAGDGEVPTPPDPRRAGQDVTNRLSTIMRIDVNPTDDGPLYSIPDDNPFAKQDDAPGVPSRPDDLYYTSTEALPEIYAYGFRNPWKMNFGPDGQLWVGDVGWELYEMVYNVKSGGNYGWSIVEGPNTVIPDGKRGPTPIVPAAIAYSHSEGASITGGFIYQGRAFPELQSKYIFGDYETRRIWASTVTPGVDGQADTLTGLTDLVDPSIRIVAFGEDTSDELLLLHFDEGSIYGLERNQQTDDGSVFPTTLGETGLFQDTMEQRPADGVLPFDVNEPMWNDGAVAQRFLGVPASDPINVLPSATRMKESSLRETMQFPLDSVLARTVTLSDDSGKQIRLETQVLHFNGRVWNPYTYVWNTSQTDAQLAPAEGMEISLAEYGTFAERRLWNVHSRSECMRCHNSWVGGVLSFTLPQLNRSNASTASNQISHYRDIGLLTGAVPDDPVTTSKPTEAALVSSHDDSADLSARVRSYLSVNCAHCHQRGAGGTATIELQHNIAIKDMKIIDVNPVQGTFQIPNAAIVASAAPFRSVLLYRVACSGRGRMPHIGSSLVDAHGVRLLQQWIASLPSNSTPSASQPDLNSTSGALQLVAQLDDNEISAADRDSLLKAARTAAPEIRNLFTRFQPLQYRKQLRNRLNAEEILRLQGNAERGAALFAGKSLQCTNCHRVNRTGGQIGPALDDAGKRLPRAEILEAILLPSKKIEPKYAAWTAVTAEGRIFSGLLIDRSENSVTLRTAKNENITINRDDLDELVQQATSLMPDRLVNELSNQQIADLVDFLSTRREQ